MTLSLAPGHQTLHNPVNNLCRHGVTLLLNPPSSEASLSASKPHLPSTRNVIHKPHRPTSSHNAPISTTHTT